MTKQREFKETPSLWLKFEEVQGIPPIGKAGNLLPDDPIKAIPLGKFAVITEAPKAKAQVGAHALSRAFKERLRESIVQIIENAHSSDRDFKGLTVDEVLECVKEQVRPEDRKRLNTNTIVRKLLEALYHSKRLERAGRPYKYSRLDKSVNVHPVRSQS